MEKKPSSISSFSLFFKRLNRKGSESESSGSGSGCRSGSGSGSGSAWRWKLKSSAGLRWKKRFNLHLWFIDDVLFKVVSAFEAVCLVSALCFFFLCCGCHF